MKAQKYKTLGSGSATTDKIHVGQFVKRTNADTEILGYISAVNPYSFDIVLFEPDEIPDNNNFIVIHETMTNKEVVADLELLLISNRQLIPLWEEIVNNTKLDPPKED